MLDATKPSDSEDFAESIGRYERETRAAVNTLEAQIGQLGVITTFTELRVSAGQTTIAIGAGLNDVPIETVILTGAGAAAIQSITGARSGQIKIIIMGDALVGMVDGSSGIVGGVFDLNQLPPGGSFGNYQGDILWLVNIGGDPSANVDGYWKETNRAPSVK